MIVGRIVMHTHCVMRDRAGHHTTLMFDAVLALPLELYQAERESSHRYAVGDRSCNSCPRRRFV